MRRKRKGLPKRNWFLSHLIMMNSRRRIGTWSKSTTLWSKGWEQVRKTLTWLRKRSWWKMTGEPPDNRERVLPLQDTTTEKAELVEQQPIEFNRQVEKVHPRIRRLVAVLIGTTFSITLLTVVLSLTTILKIRNKSLTFRQLGAEIVIHKTRVGLNIERVVDLRPTRIVTQITNNSCKPKLTMAWLTAMKFTVTMS